MARLEVAKYDGLDQRPITQAKVTLSRRNLLALLHKLDMESSARRLENTHVTVFGELVDDLILVLCCEDDDEHYRHPERGSAIGKPGRMHSETEAFIREN